MRGKALTRSCFLYFAPPSPLPLSLRRGVSCSAEEKQLNSHLRPSPGPAKVRPIHER